MKRKITIAIVLMGVISLFLSIPFISFDANLNQESIQNYFESWGNWGFLLFFLWGTISVIFTPLNFSLVGLAGGFVYGPLTGSIICWLCKIVGNSTNYYLAHRYGRRILKMVIQKDDMKKYDRLLKSEKVFWFYFILCFIPFTPSDNIAYLLGFSAMDKKTFLYATFLGNIGTAFGLAYLGSGQGLTDPLFLTSFGALFIFAMLWLQSFKKQIMS